MCAVEAATLGGRGRARAHPHRVLERLLLVVLPTERRARRLELLHDDARVPSPRGVVAHRAKANTPASRFPFTVPKHTWTSARTKPIPRRSPAASRFRFHSQLLKHPPHSSHLHLGAHDVGRRQRHAHLERIDRQRRRHRLRRNHRILTRWRSREGSVRSMFCEQGCFKSGRRIRCRGASQ